MELPDLLAAYANDNRICLIDNTLKIEGSSISIKGINGALSPFFAAGLFMRTNYNHLFIMDDWEQAAYFENDLSALLEKKEILFLPSSYKKQGVFDELNNNQVLQRTQTFNKFLQHKKSVELIITYPEAILEKIVKAEKLKEHTIYLKVGERVDLDFIL